MGKAVGFICVLLSVGVAVAGSKPLATANKFDGKFLWIKVSPLSETSLKSLAHAKAILVKVSFPGDVALKADAHGNSWFTFILADQGSDYKWHQTSKGASVPLSGGRIKAGSYTLALPIDGIPKNVLSDKIQIISLGPSSSGVVRPASFSVEQISGRKTS